jgi:hypothetical protein
MGVPSWAVKDHGKRSAPQTNTNAQREGFRPTVVALIVFCGLQ